MRDLMPWLSLIFQRKGRLLTGGLLMGLTALSGIGLLSLSGWFITETALVGLAITAGAAATINLYTPGGGIRLFAITRTLSRYLERLYNHDTVLRLLTDIRVALFSRLTFASHADRSHLRNAQWLSRLTTDVDALDTLYLRLIAPTALAIFLTLLGVIIVAWVMDGSASLWIAVLLVLALMTATVLLYKRTAQLSGELGTAQDRLRTDVIEHLEGLSELTAAGRAGKHSARLRRYARELSAAQISIERRISWHQAIVQMLVHLSAVAALWLGLQLYVSGQMSGPLMVLVPIGLLGLAEVFTSLPDAFGRLGFVTSAAKRLNAMSARNPSARASALSEAQLSGFAVRVCDVTIRHPNQAALTHHFSLDVLPGERIAITGYSGSGKSSLADVMAGLYPPEHGQVISASTSYLTQRSVLFEDTLRDNLLIGNPDASDDELWGALRAVELADWALSQPGELALWLGPFGARLSGGQARRVALARVLLNPAKVVILDEPFTGLDTATQRRVKQNLKGYLAGKTVISFGHSAEALPDSDRVIHLDN